MAARYGSRHKIYPQSLWDQILHLEPEFWRLSQGRQREPDGRTPDDGEVAGGDDGGCSCAAVAGGSDISETKGYETSLVDRCALCGGE